jgi:hypothetical protein
MDFEPLKMVGFSFKMFGTTYPVTQCHISGDRILVFKYFFSFRFGTTIKAIKLMLVLAMPMLSLQYDSHQTIVISSASARMEEYADGKTHTLHSPCKRVSHLQDAPPEAVLSQWKNKGEWHQVKSLKKTLSKQVR